MSPGPANITKSPLIITQMTELHLLYQPPILPQHSRQDPGQFQPKRINFCRKIRELGLALCHHTCIAIEARASLTFNHFVKKRELFVNLMSLKH